MAGSFIAATPTPAAACAYVEETERRWGQSGEIEEISLTTDKDGFQRWVISTKDNMWDVWMERAGDGFRVYGEC